MRLQLATYVITALLFALPACGRDTLRSDVRNPMQARVDAVVDALQRSQVGRIEIVAVPSRVETAIAITSTALEQHPDYRLVVRDIRASALRKPLSDALSSLVVAQSSDPGDLRWGVVFYDLQDKRLLGIFVDRYGQRGTIDSAPVSARGQFFQWLSRTFSGAFP